MTHIESFISSLKIGWVVRYLNANNSGAWKLFFDFYLSEVGKSLFFKCNCKVTDLTHIPNVFITNVCHAWSSFNFLPVTNNFTSQIIWNNSYIRVNDKIVYYSRLFGKNVQYVNDFFDDTGRPLSFQEFNTKFNIVSLPFTLYWGLVHSIPLNWRESILTCNKRNATLEVLCFEVDYGLSDREYTKKQWRFFATDVLKV